MWVAEEHGDSERVTIAHQGRREVTALGRSYESRVSRSRVMELGNPCGAERLRHSGEGGLCGKIGAHMVSHQHGGAFIDDIERLDHMLLFAMWISWNAGGVFKVELPRLASARDVRGARVSWEGEKRCVRFPVPSR
jgi:hypothetical protein